MVCTTSRLGVVGRACSRVSSGSGAPSRRLVLSALVTTLSALAFTVAVAPALAAGPPVLEEEASVLKVTSTSAKLQAQINPEESETTYHFEYDTKPYAAGEAPHGTSVPIPDGSLGAGATGVTVRVEPEGLLPGTTYHYRVIATAGSETIDGTDRTFTTQESGGEFSLLDGRQWEMVSPPNKHGSTILPLTQEGVLEAAADGSAITYMTNAPTELEPKGSSSIQQQVISRRVGGGGGAGNQSPSGWGTEYIATPHDNATGYIPGIGFEYRFFSSDLSLALVEPQGVNAFTPLSSQATERTPYIRFDSTCETAPSTCYEPLVTAADVRPGAKFGGGPAELLGEVSFVGATADLSHVLLADNNAGLTSTSGDEGGLYEWSPSGAGQLQLVSILPESEGGKPVSISEPPSPGSEYSGRGEISADGSRVFWSTTGLSEHLYLRDMVKGDMGETLRIGNAVADEFQIANSEGSRVLFVAKENSASFEGTLEACNVIEVKGKLACKTTALAPKVQRSVIGASEDGSYVYFVSTADLAAKAVFGEDNLYVDHNNGTAWEAPELVATLPEEDVDDWEIFLSQMTARVSPNGEWLAFMSRRRLTGYDNRDAVSGEPDEEVYLYNAADGRLACASCDPTSARPVGTQYGERGDYGGNGLLGGGAGIWPSTTWLAANIQGWTTYTDHAAGSLSRTVKSLYQAHYLSDSGRLFFNSSDALVPQDVNGTWDVYEYEPEGVGSCVRASVSGSVVYRPERETASGAVEPGGCVGLISSGESPEQSAFLDASENGKDVFFLTTSQLVPQDVDTYFDVYDAHVCSASVPCLSSSASSPPCDTAEACRAAPSPQPEVFGAPTTATFSGEGNVAPQTGPPAKPAVKEKTVKCKRGFVKRKVKKREQCVKVKGKKQAKRASRNRGARS